MVRPAFRPSFPPLLGLLLTGLLLPSLAGASFQEIDPTRKAFAEATGGYGVEVLVDGVWQSAGRLNYDIYYREHALDLSAHCESGPVSVRLTPLSRREAHLDAALLGGAPALSVDAAAGLAKLGAVDFDVLDSDGEPVVLHFAGPGSDGQLAVTARIEAAQVCGVPFQLPLANMFRTMGPDSAFYSYQLGTPASQQPLSQEWARAVTGHPSGPIFTWAHDDGQQLYVTVDFTGDNTMDGDADWARVYVRTEAGLRQFTVSVPEQRWGTPHFSYTDKVSYQHKVYDFVIPLNELGLDGLAGEIGLAFAAYGTCAGGYQQEPELAFSPAADRYLLAYIESDFSCNRQAYAASLDSLGVMVGNAVQLSGSPVEGPLDIAYNSLDDEFLVVWKGAGGDIHGQLVDPDAAVIGGVFLIADMAGQIAEPAVAYSRDDNRFLVAWTDDSGTAIRGSFVEADGSLLDIDGDGISDPFSDHVDLSDMAGWMGAADVTWDADSNQFLVAWQADAGGLDIYGRVLDPSGMVVGMAFPIAVNGWVEQNPAVAAITSGTPYLTVFDNQNQAADIYGQLVDAGANLGSGLDVSTANGDQWSPRVAGDSHNGRWVTAWTDLRNGWELWGQLVWADGTLQDHAGDGTPADDNYAIASLPGGVERGALGHNPSCQNYLVATQSGYGVVGTQVMGPCLEPGHDYGEVEVGADATYSFVLTNTDADPVTVGSLTIDGPGAADFAVDYDECAGATLAEGDLCLFDVVFAPGAADAAGADLTVTTDHPASPTLRVLLDGVGTGGAPEFPEVIATSPADGDQDVAVNTSITATFSIPMDPATIDGASLTVLAGADPVSGAVSYAGEIATFLPAADLLEGTEYTATVTTAATSTEGAALVADFDWTFTTVEMVADDDDAVDDDDTVEDEPEDSGRDCTCRVDGTPHRGVAALLLLGVVALWIRSRRNS